jgi:hypothetical protein
MAAVQSDVQCIPGEGCGELKVVKKTVDDLTKRVDRNENHSREDINGLHEKLDKIILAGLTAAGSGIIALIIALSK